MARTKYTLADIAKLAEVSKSTVSFVLNGHAQKHRIPESTVEKVLEITQRLNYRPSSTARALRTKQSQSYGLIIPDIANRGFALIAKELEKLCRNAGVQLLMASTNDDVDNEKEIANQLIARDVDKLIVASGMKNADFYNQLNLTTPVVAFDRSLENSDFPTVTTDTRSTTESLLLECLEGVEECFYIGGQPELSSSQLRLSGYHTAMARLHIDAPDSHIFELDYEVESGYKMMKQVLEVNPTPQALFVASHSLMQGVLKCIFEHQLSNVRLCCFDDDPIYDCLAFPIHSIEQDCQAIASSIFSLLTTETPVKNQHHKLAAILHHR
ncbi:sucrose operon repressor scrR, lacI family [Vibrio ishigakensis]|uniref:Sucrose operon repressor scrR, lacI family n=1 Tax=Vibrio ishigakensis TaxID=1481914 RepID=A0A0B8P542_9VIBR|nr:LacI family DNA-binding transcriptional regulator [Vibrio ishigakensis]GAM58383.1 sucrose operon repressor scrR, lacI family [Vibrio ishigakensis]